MAKKNFPFPIESEPQKIYFSTAARIAKLLGRDSIADPVIALLELIKNSYDADATEVMIIFENMRHGGAKIIITDNGIGMTEQDIKDKWMRAATNDKEHNPVSLEYKRRKIGEKGIGRFATERLAKKIIFVSRPKNLTEGYGVVINWEDFEKNADDDFDKIPNQLYPFKKKKTERGLEIHLENLNEKWDEERIKKFYDNVSLITPPIGGPKKFTPRIRADEFPKYSGKIKSSFLKQADYIFNGKLEKNGGIRYSFTPYGGKTYKVTERLTQFSCGSVEFQLYFYYLGDTEYIPKRDVAPRDFETRKAILQDFAGIKLYRDNFRIKPFGDPGNDWLDINSERVNDPSNYPGNNQIFGFVKLKRDENSGINDTTSRENILDTTEFKDLKKFMKGSLKFFAKKKKEVEGKNKISRSKGKGKRKGKLKNLIRESFKKTASKNLIPHDLIEKLPTTLANTTNEINGCLGHGFLTAAAVLMRKALENALILKFKQESNETDILTAGEYIELPQIIERAKQNRYINSTIARRVNKIKIFGDTAAHSYRITIRPDDVEPMTDLLRLTLEDLSLKKTKQKHETTK